MGAALLLTTAVLVVLSLRCVLLHRRALRAKRKIEAWLADYQARRLGS